MNRRRPATSGSTCRWWRGKRGDLAQSITANPRIRESLVTDSRILGFAVIFFVVAPVLILYYHAGNANLIPPLCVASC